MSAPAVVRRALTTVLPAVRTWAWAEFGATAALLTGWALVTWAIAEVAPARIVWRASGGLLLLSVFGFRLLIVLARDGLYALTRDKKP